MASGNKFVAYRPYMYFNQLSSQNTDHLKLGLQEPSIVTMHRVRTGGVRTTIAMHCGFKIFKMAAKVEKFRRLYALFFNRYSSFLRSFSRFHKLILVYIFSVKKNKSIFFISI